MLTPSTLRERLTAWRGSARGGVAALATGTGLAAALHYLTLPVLTRLYPPEAFGVADAFVAAVLLVAPVTSLRYEDAVLLPERDEDAASVLAWSLLLTVLAALGTLLLLPLRTDAALLLGEPRLAPLLPFVPLAVAVQAGGRVAGTWLRRTHRFEALAGARTAVTTTTVAVRLGAVLLVSGVGAAGLAGGYVAGQAVGALVVLALAVPAWRGLPLRRVLRTARLRWAARRYRAFAAFGAPAQLLHALASRLPTLLLLALFDERVVGHYGRATLLLVGPLGLLGAAVGQVFGARGAEAVRAGTLDALTTRVHRRLVRLALPPALLLVAAGPDVAETLFGEAWRPSGVYAQVLTPWLVLVGISSTLTSIFDLTEAQRRDLAITLLVAGLPLAALAAGSMLDLAPLPLLALLSAAGLLARIAQLTALLHLAGVTARAAFRPYARALLVGVPATVALAALTFVAPTWLVTVAAAVMALGWVGFEFRVSSSEGR